ncbi:HDOD domain-containing protein [Burkholderia cenocepacia]|uniref:HDOD domain-containing protein n=1 Tax=Burkholderia cenocepacia TaxID=95486 RepID=UPI000761BE81|nr:HDOD domain-containing protein [Burkholderia cenocepacia]KWU17908.1 hypothetical protein AS149_14630 [Burkholderia cenocepacia]
MLVEQEPGKDSGDAPALGMGLKQLKIPPLSDAVRTLLSLSEEDRMNLRVMELVCWKDPGAVARVVAQASSAYMYGSTGGPNRPTGKPLSLSDAIAAIGVDSVYDLLLAMWGVHSMHLPQEQNSERDHLAKHIFTMFATARRVVIHAELVDEVPAEELLLLIMVDQLSLALALAPTADPELRHHVRRHIAEGRSAFHRIPEVAPAFKMSRAITQAWNLSSRLDGYLATLDHWQMLAGNLQPAVSVVLCSEAILEAAKLPESADNVRTDLVSVDPVAQQLMEKGIDPLSLAVTY